MGIIDTLSHIDKTLFLFLNGLHHASLDPVMQAITGKFIWLPLYAFLIFRLIKDFGKGSIPYLLAIALLITLSDRISSGFIKPAAARLRPCYDLAIAPMVHVVNGCGGNYGFVSSHAANTFAVAVFIMLCYPQNKILRYGLLFWAVLVSYSRIYMGVHYPGDLLCGAALGSLLALVVFNTEQRIHHLFAAKAAA